VVLHGLEENFENLIYKLYFLVIIRNLFTSVKPKHTCDLMHDDSPSQDSNADRLLCGSLGSLLALVSVSFGRLILTLFFHHFHIVSPISNLLCQRRGVLVNVKQLQINSQIFTNVRFIVEFVDILKDKVKERRILSAIHRMAVESINIVEFHLC
jgi:hypothetical protein